ncbi:cytochrome P450 [Polyangium mundeleinium]|uniref:Cytochrome P450 n=1 Tax=Polyangium mundeleinium TaxID=2995306 RepID=A0ABT5EN78_9BACT|nr:cytochrome P450 [Polyangium mundeleinium]MDC0743293.1 cytochrome P450 [Polyangium mundeleinium]
MQRVPGLPLPPALTLPPFLYRPFPFLEAMAKRYPDAFTMRFPANPKPAVVFHHPDAAKEIFALGPDDAHAGQVNAVLGPILGKASLLLLDGKEHLRQRKLLMPPLHGERMASYGARMVALTEASIAGWPARERFPVHERLQAITLDVILRVVFGIGEGELFHRLRERLVEILELTTNPIFLVPMFQRDLGPLTRWNSLVRALHKADEMLYGEIRRRRTSGERGDDILSLLLDARDEAGEPMSDGELRDELMTLLAAGHETTATALSWGLRWILASKSLVARLVRELETEGALPDLAPERIARCALLDATARETLRLQPVVLMVGRLLQRPMRIGGYDLEAGTPALVSIYLIHRRPDLYPDPTRFDPDRFLRQRFAPHEWLPFGGGIRRCIGMAFALYEMKMILATILARTELRLPRFGKVHEVRRGVTIAPSRGMPLVMERRDSSRIHDRKDRS